MGVKAGDVDDTTYATGLVRDWKSGRIRCYHCPKVSMVLKVPNPCRFSFIWMRVLGARKQSVICSPKNIGWEQHGTEDELVGVTGSVG